jgi:DNA-binding transcriptional LysR family regulator
VGAAASNRNPGAIDNHWLSTQIGGVDLDTGLLRAFVATVEENHFGRAAARLFVTQQALSKRIHKLEEILGARLFDRTNRRVDLTAAGERFLPHARRALAAVDAAAGAVGVGAGPFRVDVMYEHLSVLRLVREALEHDPDLPVEITTQTSLLPTVPALRRGDVDIAFGRAIERPWPADVRRRLALLEPIGLLVGADHPLAVRSTVELAELRDLRLWFPTASAPVDWTSLLDELTDEFDIKLDPAGPKAGFDYFLDRPARDLNTVTLYGLGMPPPAITRLRVVPIVAPTPVFAWSVMWRPRVPESVIDRLLAYADLDVAVPVEVAADPDRVWLPAADRTWVSSAGRPPA